MQRQIIQSFKLHGLSLQVSAVRYLMEVVKDLDSAGTASFLDELLHTLDKKDLENPIVSKDTLERAVEDMTKEESEVAREYGLVVLNSDDFPKYDYDPSLNGFVHVSDRVTSLHGTSKDKSDMFRQRLLLIQQRLVRSDLFAKDVLPQQNGDVEMSGSHRFDITSIESLVGSPGKHVLLAYLSQLQQNTWSLEDLTGHIKIDLSHVDNSSMAEGMFTEKAIVLAEGEVKDGVFQVATLGFPPAETRAETDRALGTTHDFFGGRPPSRLLQQVKEIEDQSTGSMFVVVSDIWLDKPAVFEKLRLLFAGFEDDVPAAFILIGPFSSQGTFEKEAAQGDQMKLRQRFEDLAALIKEYPDIATNSRFVVMGGPNEAGSNALPRFPLPKTFVQPMMETPINAANASNPCRLRYFTKEIVVFREDLLMKMNRHCIKAPNLDQEEDISKHLVVSLLHQNHLCPLPLSVRPVYWTKDYALRLYPLPDVIILADRHQNFCHLHNDVLCFNPGSFSTDYSFATYTPDTKSAEFYNVG
eukprot:TRINITY_DN1244_c1_g1_i1.p1 TRINITY_DN1244_c1_g1~~TRINITY_DN1244_c1_g1_i1.p1  ORF type:complete len:537 (+),score=108.27 TRINITY_DN1244_c1_g1_i1:33-1613(+)